MTFNSTNLEGCQKLVLPFERDSSNGSTVLYHSELAMDAEGWKNGTTDLAIAGGDIRPVEPSPIGRDRLGLLSLADAPTIQEDKSTETKLSPDATTTLNLNGVSRAGEASNQAELFGAVEGPTDSESVQTWRDTHGHPAIGNHDPNAGPHGQPTEKGPFSRGPMITSGFAGGCKTEDQARASAYHLIIGGPINPKIGRWSRGASLTYSVDSGTFPSAEDEAHAAISIEKAGSQWNQIGGNVPSFKQVQETSAAVFKLKYQNIDKTEIDDNKTLTFAKSFFPGDKPATVYVYPLAFENEYRKYLPNVFLHELGHVLGARHEFAPESWRSEGPCKILGERNPASVMNWHSHLSKLAIQDSDAKDMKRFYDLDGAHYDGYPIEVHVPQMLSPNSKSLASMDQSSGSKLADPGKTRFLGLIDAESTIKTWVGAALISFIVVMGLWLG